MMIGWYSLNYILDIYHLPQYLHVSKGNTLRVRGKYACLRKQKKCISREIAAGGMPITATNKDYSLMYSDNDNDNDVAAPRYT